MQLIRYPFSRIANLSYGPTDQTTLLFKGRLKGESQQMPSTLCFFIIFTIPADTYDIFLVLLLTYSNKDLAELTTYILKYILMSSFAFRRSLKKLLQISVNFQRQNLRSQKRRSYKHTITDSNLQAYFMAYFLPYLFHEVTKSAFLTLTSVEFSSAFQGSSILIFSSSRERMSRQVNSMQFPRILFIPIYIIIMSKLLRTLTKTIRFNINTELIKQDINKKLLNPKGPTGIEYPKTFQQKVILLNDPRSIQKLQIIEFGVKYKPGKKYLSLLLALAALFFYINQKKLPEKVLDRYFSISNSSNLEYCSGFLFSAFMFENPFYYYLPLLVVVNQLSKFVSNRWIIGLMLANGLINGALGKYLVDERVKEYEVWDQERISYGQGTFLSFANCLWGALGIPGGFTAIKSKVFLKSVPGLGIIRAGIPIGYICLFYMLLEGYLHIKQGKKNSELMTVCALNGFITGLLIRRFSPLK